MVELPTNLFIDRFWPVRGSQTNGFDGVGGGAQCVGSHVADGDGLTGGSGSGQGGGSVDVTRSYATDESTPDFVGRVELSPGEGAGPRDGRAGAIITWSFGLEQRENSLGAVGGPCGVKTSVGFAQRLRRPHGRSHSEIGGE